MLHHAHLIVRRLIVRVMAKIAHRQTSIVTRLRVVISLIVASVVLLLVKIARQRVTALIVLLSRIVQIVHIVRIGVRIRSAAQVTVIRVRLGAVMIAPRRVVNMRMQRRRNVVNSHRVLSVVIVQSMTSCRFSAQRA